MQDTILFHDIAFDINVENLMEKLHIPSDFLQDFTCLAQKAKETAKPKGAFKLCGFTMLEGNQIQIGQTILTGSLLKTKLKSVHRVFPYLITEGKELAEWAVTLDYLDLLFINALREDILQQAKTHVEKFIKTKYSIKQLSHLNPGSLSAWPISEQKPFFELMAPIPEKLNIDLLPSMLMHPEFSVSGIFFQTETQYVNCSHCPRTECPNRRAPFTEEID